MVVDLGSLCFCSDISSLIWTALLTPPNPVGATNVKHEMHMRHQCYIQPIKLELSSVLPALHRDTRRTFTLAIKIHSRPGSKFLWENRLPHSWVGGFLTDSGSWKDPTSRKHLGYCSLQCVYQRVAVPWSPIACQYKLSQ